MHRTQRPAAPDWACRPTTPTHVHWEQHQAAHAALLWIVALLPYCQLSGRWKSPNRQCQARPWAVGRMSGIQPAPEGQRILHHMQARRHKGAIAVAHTQREKDGWSAQAQSAVPAGRGRPSPPSLYRPKQIQIRRCRAALEPCTACTSAVVAQRAKQRGAVQVRCRSQSGDSLESYSNSAHAHAYHGKVRCWPVGTAL